MGESIPMYFYTDAVADTASFGTKYVKPSVSLTMHLVGTVIPNDDVLLDQVDRLPELIIYTPALDEPVVNNALHYNLYASNSTTVFVTFRRWKRRSSDAAIGHELRLSRQLRRRRRGEPISGARGHLPRRVRTHRRIRGIP